MLLGLAVSQPFTPQLAHAELEWTTKRQLNLEASPLDVSASADGQLMFILAPGEILIYSSSEGKVVSRNLVTLVRPKHIELHDPKLAAKVGRGRADGTFRVTLSAKTPALWAWIELKGVDARFSDNFVCVRPGLPVTIKVTPHKKMSLAEFRKKLVTRSLFDTY